MVRSKTLTGLEAPVPSLFGEKRQEEDGDKQTGRDRVGVKRGRRERERQRERECKAARRTDKPRGGKKAGSYAKNPRKCSL